MPPKPTGPATIRDVARRAGVSTATVSRVLAHPDVVATATRQKVARAVKQLGYRPNSAAKNLRTMRTGKILVTVPDIANPFFSLILQGIENAAARAGYAVLLGDTQHDEKRENEYAEILLRKEADGLIFLGHRLPNAAATLVRASRPRCAPVVNGCEFSPGLGVPSVHIDNEKAADEALAYLCRLGHKHVGVITGPLASPLSGDRLRGALSRARAERIDKQITVVQGDFSIESGVIAAEQLLRETPRVTAIFCFNDEMAIGVLETARRRNVRVPEELSLVGFDDIRFARHMDPPLTTVVQPMREIGEGTVRLLLEILDGRVKAPISLTLPHSLVIRASTAPVPSTHTGEARPEPVAFPKAAVLSSKASHDR